MSRTTVGESHTRFYVNIDVKTKTNKRRKIVVTRIRGEVERR